MKKADNILESQFIPVRTDERGVIICPECGGKVHQCQSAVVLHHRPVKYYETSPVRIHCTLNGGVNIQGLPVEDLEEDDYLQIHLEYTCSNCSDLEEFMGLALRADRKGLSPRLGWVAKV